MRPANALASSSSIFAAGHLGSSELGTGHVSMSYSPARWFEMIRVSVPRTFPPSRGRFPRTFPPELRVSQNLSPLA